MKILDRLKDLYASSFSKLDKEKQAQAEKLYGLAVMKESDDWALFQENIISDMSTVWYEMLGASQDCNDAKVVGLCKKLNAYMEIYGGPDFHADQCFQLLTQWSESNKPNTRLSNFNERPQMRAVGGSI